MHMFSLRTGLLQVETLLAMMIWKLGNAGYIPAKAHSSMKKLPPVTK
jgi:hypothetical protein